jgi:hypothetical protein
MFLQHNRMNLQIIPASFILFIICLFHGSVGFTQTPDKSYVSSDKIFILTYPGTWKKAGGAGASGEIVVNAPDNSLFKPCQVQAQINSIDEAYKGYNIRELAEVELKMLKASSNEKNHLEVLNSDFKTFNNKQWWVVHGKMHQGKEFFLTNSYKTIHSGKVYILTFISVEKNFEKNAPAALKMVETFEFLTKDATVYNTKL